MRRTNRDPSLRCHKASGQGFVEIDGHRHYLGRFDKSETRERYHRFLAEWEANGRRLAVDPDEITIIELCARFWEYVGRHYKGGHQSGEAAGYKIALRALRVLPESSTKLEIVEHTAKIIHLARQVGSVSPLPPEEVEKLLRMREELGLPPLE